MISRSILYTEGQLYQSFLRQLVYPQIMPLKFEIEEESGSFAEVHRPGGEARHATDLRIETAK